MLQVNQLKGPTYRRGAFVFESHRIERHRYLLEQTTEDVWLKRQKVKGKRSSLSNPIPKFNDPRPPPGIIHPSCLFTVYGNKNSNLKWAPRDAMEHACTTLADWRSHGYGSHQLLLSLIGNKADETELRRLNPFVWAGYSYLYLNFDTFASVLKQMNPIDRFFCFVIPEGVPVHMYFDIDGDFGEFPNIIGKEEECLNEVVKEVQLLFEELFGREMDCSGLTLLQATSATKMSWHLHNQSEAFVDVHHMKQFVLELNKRLKEKDSTLLYRSAIDTSLDKSLVDPAPYMVNQNFRAPYCRKPNKTALLPRTFSFDSGVLTLNQAEAADDLQANIDEELLWKCHPALAQPGPGYEYLELEIEKGRKKRKRSEESLTTSNRARKLASSLDVSSTRVNVMKVAGAVDGSVRPLEEADLQLVRTALQPHLGSEVEINSGSWYKSLRNSEAVIRGTCDAGTAICITQTGANEPYIHSSNRMYFTLRASGQITVGCFKCNRCGGAPDHQFKWEMNEEECKMMCVVSANQPIGIPQEDVLEEKEPAPRLSQRGMLTRWVRCIQKETPNFRPAPVFDCSNRTAVTTGRAALAGESKVNYDRMLDAFQSIAGLGPNGQLMGRDELYNRFCEFKEASERVVDAIPKKWKKELEITERYLSPEDDKLLGLFRDHSHLAIQSGQGTNKTGFLLCMMLILLRRNPKTRMLILSNRITYANTVLRRCEEFDKDVAQRCDRDENLQPCGPTLGFRSYTEKEFRVTSESKYSKNVERLNNPSSRLTEQQRIELKKKLDKQREEIDEVNRRLVQTPRLIMSPQSLSRLFSAKTEGGMPIVPYYDVIIPDEFMELLSLFQGSTMNDKRRTTLDYWTSLMTRAKHVWVADAGLNDETALPMLKWLTGGKSFVKMTNTQKTIDRKYFRYSSLAQWRKKIVAALKSGLNVFVVCNTRAQVESIMNDPEIVALGIEMRGLHAESCADDRRDYINTVENWSKLQLLVISPVISHGVNFDMDHFDVAMWYASDNSTTTTQAFQQLNRSRKIRSNEVHMFLDLHQKQHQHLTCEYDQLRDELDQQVRKYHFDWFKLNINPFGMRAYRIVDMPIKEINPTDPIGDEGQFVFDTKVCPVTCVRKLFDSAGNELFIRNQVEVNRSRVNFEAMLLAEIEE